MGQKLDAAIEKATCYHWFPCPISGSNTLLKILVPCYLYGTILFFLWSILNNAKNLEIDDSFYTHFSIFSQTPAWQLNLAPLSLPKILTEKAYLPIDKAFSISLDNHIIGLYIPHQHW